MGAGGWAPRAPLTLTTGSGSVQFDGIGKRVVSVVVICYGLTVSMQVPANWLKTKVINCVNYTARWRSCGAVHCNRPCLFVCVFVGLLIRQLEIACIDPHQTGSVGKGSDHLQMTKFWPSRAPGKGVCGGAKFFGSALLRPARSVCVASERFFHYH